MNRDRLRGVTLVEVLTAIGVLWTLTLLVIPVLRNARASAREATCIDNLRQIGLALHNYHAANDCLPMSQVRGEGHGNGHSVFTIILPYLEQAAIYNAYNFWLEVEHVANLTAVRTRMATYLCPDNPAAEDLEAREALSLKEGDLRVTVGRFPESKVSFGRGHYGANWGGGRGSWGEDFLKKHGDYRGVMMTVIA